MDNPINHHSYKTQLRNRELWFDGESTFHQTNLNTWIAEGAVVKWVNEITDEVLAYNKLVPKEQRIGVKDTCNPLNFDWVLPEQYLGLDVFEYVINEHINITEHMDDDEIELRDKRLIHELKLFQQFNMMDVLKAIIYIINMLLSNNVVWGVGRGSSVSSYVLYVIGVHSVDSFEYDLDITDFLHN